MSNEYEAAQEICAVLHAIDQNLDRIWEDMPTQRERIATAALAGYLAMHADGATAGPSAAVAAKRAVEYADAMIAELSKENEL